MLGFGEVYRYHAGKMDWAAMGLPIEGAQAAIPTIGAAAARDVPTCRTHERLGDIRKRTEAAGWELCVVVNDERVVLGLLDGDALNADAAAVAEEVMDRGPTTYRPNLFAEDALHYMHRQNMSHVLVTTSDGELIGVLRPADAERAVAESSVERRPAPSGEGPYRR